MSVNYAYAARKNPPNGGSIERERYLEKPPVAGATDKEGTITRKFNFSAKAPERPKSYFGAFDYDNLTPEQLSKEVYKALDFMEEELGYKDIAKNSTFALAYCCLKDEDGDVLYECSGPDAHRDYLKFLHDNIEWKVGFAGSFDYEKWEDPQLQLSNEESASTPPKEPLSKTVLFGNMRRKCGEITEAISGFLAKLKSEVIPVHRTKSIYDSEDKSHVYLDLPDLNGDKVNEGAIHNIVRDACLLTKDLELTKISVDNFLVDCFNDIKCSDARKEKIVGAVNMGYESAEKILHNERMVNFDYSAIELNEEGYVLANPEVSDIGRYIFSSPIEETDYKVVLANDYNLADQTETINLLILNENNEEVYFEEYDTVKGFNRRELTPVDLRRELDVIAKAKVNEVIERDDI